MLLNGEKQASVAAVVCAPVNSTNNRSDSALHNDKFPWSVVVAKRDFSIGENLTLLIAYKLKNDATILKEFSKGSCTCPLPSARLAKGCEESFL